MEFHALCIQPAHTVQQALRQLDQTGKKILFLTDAAGHLTAALTDGDVRRYLLAGGINGLLYAPSIGEDGVCVGHGSGRLSMRWTDMTAIWRVYARYGSGLYFFDRDVPSAHPHVRKDGARTPAREPMSCLSLADTHLLLLAVSMYCPDSAVRRIYR